MREDNLLIDKSFVKAGLLIVLSAVLTLILQGWVGLITIYSEDMKDKRILVHEMILNNQLPDEGKTWRDYGANSVNIRIITVYIAEGLHHVSKIPVLKIYFIIDTLSLFITFLLLFYFLRKWVNPASSLIGVFYYACVCIMTYFLFYFHPWDRLSMVMWLILLILLKEDHLISFGILLIITMAIKFDVILLPGLYWLIKVSKSNWKRVTFITLILFICTFGTYWLLRIIFPGGFAQDGLEVLLFQIEKNISVMLSYNLRYPPLLGFVIPILLAFYTIKSKDRFTQASAIFGVLLLLVFFLNSNFIEIRAEMPVLVLLMPAALISFEKIVYR